MKQYRALGMMTGSSLDGVDLALCRLNEQNGKWKYEIEKAEVVPLAPKWKQRLQSLVLQNAVGYLKTDAAFGHYLGEVAAKFISENNLHQQIDFIASHGQTVFHQPENQMTSQIGDGAAISALTGQVVICNFRTADVALGGQGTPIAPIADLLLFPEFNCFLNIGGIVNLSVRSQSKVIGFDICPANAVLNQLVSEINLDYDKDGMIAASGKIQEQLLYELDEQWYYQKSYPKSIGGGWISKIFLPTYRKYHCSIEDKLRTTVEHIATQIGKDIRKALAQEGIDSAAQNNMLICGGGAFNRFLLDRINSFSPVPITLPDPLTIKFKEALLMALMGALRLRGEVNVLSSVTGATKDSIGGAIFLPPAANHIPH